MQGKKNNPKLQILFAAMFLALVFVMELYAMINMQTQFLVIGVLGIVFLACIYMLIRAILLLQAEKESRREEQYENIFKSEKASYLMMKKHFEEIEKKLDVLEEMADIPIDEIMGMQKAIGKVIINRNRENAEAIINSNEELQELFESLKDETAANSEKLVQSYKNISEDNMQQIMLKQQEFFTGLKDMEIRLNNAIVQSQKVAVQAAPVYASPMAAPAAPATPAEQQAGMDMADTLMENSEAGIEVATADANVMTEAAPEIAPEEPAGVSEAAPEELAGVSEAAPEEHAGVSEAAPEEHAGVAEAVSEESAGVTEEISERAVGIDESPVGTEEPESVESILASLEPAPAEEEKKPEIDMSNPNKQLGADEIESLFASMTQEITESASEPEPEEVQAAPQVDLSDPNKKMSADEIAALFASIGG